MTDQTRETVERVRAWLTERSHYTERSEPAIMIRDVRALNTALSNAEAQRDAALARLGVLEGALKAIGSRMGYHIEDANAAEDMLGNVHVTISATAIVSHINAALSPAPTVKGEVQ